MVTNGVEQQVRNRKDTGQMNSFDGRAKHTLLAQPGPTVLGAGKPSK